MFCHRFENKLTNMCEGIGRRLFGIVARKRNVLLVLLPYFWSTHCPIYIRVVGKKMVLQNGLTAAKNIKKKHSEPLEKESSLFPNQQQIFNMVEQRDGEIMRCMGRYLRYPKSCHMHIVTEAQFSSVIIYCLFLRLPDDDNDDESLENTL